MSRKLVAGEMPNNSKAVFTMSDGALALRVLVPASRESIGSSNADESFEGENARTASYKQPHTTKYVGNYTPNRNVLAPVNSAY